MGPIEIENDRDVVLGEIIMVAAVIEPVRIILIVIGVIQFYIRLFGIDEPRIAVLGLNPHAGEGGHLGEEETNIIR